jgi:hypothetical protein
MKAIASVAIAAIIAATSLTTTIAPANAGSFQFGVHYNNGGYYYGGHHRKRHHHHRRHHSGVGGAVAAGAILGLALGAMGTPNYYYQPRPRGYYPYAVGHSANAQHVSWCHNRYKSYNARTNAWFGYDGYYHQCRSPY